MRQYSVISGSLEVFHNQIWGSICKDNFIETDAKTSCRDMGLVGGKILSSKNYIGYLGKIWMDDVECPSDKDILDQSHIVENKQ